MRVIPIAARAAMERKAYAGRLASRAQNDESSPTAVVIGTGAPTTAGTRVIAR